MQKNLDEELKKISARARQLMVESLICAGCGHPGGAFSSIDLMTVLYFGGILNLDSHNWKDTDRDRFILSKGHSSIALYTILHLKGLIDKQTLLSFRQNDSCLAGHPDMHKVPGVEMSTGSLGHGLSVGVGLSLAARLDGEKYRTFVLMGDGETQEGSVWEAAMSASHYKLDNLTAIVDRNMLQIDGSTEDVMALEPYTEKWRAFGWHVREVNGHDFTDMLKAFKSLPFSKNKPSMIIAKTVKGKGISFMENRPEWHGKAVKGEFADTARRETEKQL